MSTTTIITYEQFKVAFTDCLKSTLAADKQVLNGNRNLTAYYKNICMSKLAEKLGLKLLESEFLRIDYMLGREGEHKYFVPIVAVESENNSDTNSGDIEKEIKKLLTLNCPFKVLLTRYQEVEKDLAAEEEDTYWIYAINDYRQFDQLSGYFVAASLVRIQGDDYKFVVAAYSKEMTREVFSVGN